ncbi:polysaccharide export protein [bacterium]|nr:polysaccharide export protein [bacterium]
MAKRGLLIWLTILAAVVLTGCVRGPGSPYVGPPQGTVEPTERARLRKLVNDPELHFVRPDAYRIGPGDIISIRMVGKPELFGEKPSDTTGEFEISQSPLLTLPLVGPVAVHGKTAAELQSLLTERYTNYFVDPIIVVTIKYHHQNQVTIVGSVAEPGRYPLEPGDSLVDAIYKAGGLTFGGQTGGLAPAPQLILYRERIPQQESLVMEPEDLIRKLTQEDGRIRTHDEYHVPIADFLFRGTMEYNIPLRQNDIVYVVPAGSVNVLGRVDKPGVVFLGPSVRTINHVISARGGMRYGAASYVEIVRMDEDGNPTSYYVNARRTAKRSEPDFLVRDGDEIYVYTHPFRAVCEYLGKVLGATTKAGITATYNPVGGI